jgi:hypothetical protein
LPPRVGFIFKSVILVAATCISLDILLGNRLACASVGRPRVSCMGSRAWGCSSILKYGQAPEIYPSRRDQFPQSGTHERRIAQGSRRLPWQNCYQRLVLCRHEKKASGNGNHYYDRDSPVSRVNIIFTTSLLRKAFSHQPFTCQEKPSTWFTGPIWSISLRKYLQKQPKPSKISKKSSGP